MYGIIFQDGEKGKWAAELGYRQRPSPSFQDEGEQRTCFKSMKGN